MAKSGKLKKLASSKVKQKTKPELRVAKAKVADKKAPKAVAQAAASAKANSSQPGRKVSQKLIETIEKRKAQAAQLPETKDGVKLNRFGKPMGRRGRRPKNVEYTPTHNEDEGYSNESDYEGIEYDTGIRLKSSNEDRGFGMDRFEEFDEELNFDW